MTILTLFAPDIAKIVIAKFFFPGFEDLEDANSTMPVTFPAHQTSKVFFPSHEDEETQNLTYDEIDAYIDSALMGDNFHCHYRGRLPNGMMATVRVTERNGVIDVRLVISAVSSLNQHFIIFSDEATFERVLRYVDCIYDEFVG